MDELLSRFWHDIAARPDGPMAVRFYLQPLMATLFAMRDGLKDARARKSPYFYGLVTDPEHRGEMIRDGWRSVGKIFVLAVVLDLIYQFTVLKGFRPAETLVIALVLAIVPYVLIRGLVDRVAGAHHRPSSR